MASDRISFSCVALQGTNKAGKLKPQTDGYYEIVLGGFDVYNGSGAFYPLSAAKALFENSSSLMRRIASGACRGECGHPKRTPGMDMRSFVERVCTIYEDNVACHFKEVHLDYNSVRDKDGNKVVSVIGLVKPSGPKGDALGEALENPNEDVSFSVRSLTEDRYEAGRLIKDVKTIITWDWVNEPGISFARKWHSPSLESLDESFLTLQHLELVAEGQRNSMGVSMESGTVSVESLIEDFRMTQSPETGIYYPPSARW